MQKRSFISKWDNKILHNGTRMLYAILKEHLLALGTEVSTQVNQLKQIYHSTVGCSTMADAGDRGQHDRSCRKALSPAFQYTWN